PMKYLNQITQTTVALFLLLLLSALSGCDGSVQLVSGDDHVCFQTGGNTNCFGVQNKFWAVGPNSSPRNLQKIRALATNPQSLSAGNDTNCVIVNNGAVQCWGKNMINSDALDTPKPFFIQGLGGPAKMLAIGDEHACAMVTVG